MTDKFIIKVKGEKKMIIPVDKTAILITDEVGASTCIVTVRQKITQDVILRAYNVEFWYIETLGTKNK